MRITLRDIGANAVEVTQEEDMRLEALFKVTAVSDHLDQFNEVKMEPATAIQQVKGTINLVIVDDDLLHKFGPGQIVNVAFDLPVD